MDESQSTLNMPMDGILAIDKAAGVSSFDVLRKIKAAFKKSGRAAELKKIGHAGTLDPIASGLVITLINGATKRSAEFLNMDKTYVAELFIGFSTDSYDATGKTVEEISMPPDYYDSPKNFTRLMDALASFQGEIMQEPPMYSAIKKNGRPLYELARNNITIEREKRRCVIYSIAPVSEKPVYDEPLEGFRFSYSVRCSKGTYVRSLCHDIGAFIGVPCHMSALRRIEIGGVRVEGAFAFDKIDGANITELIKNIR